LGYAVAPKQMKRLEEIHRERVKQFIKSDGFEGSEKRLKGIIPETTVRYIKKTYC